MKHYQLSFRTFIVICLFIFGTSWISTNARAVAIDFEDVLLPSCGYYNGSDYAGGFTSGGVFFPNSFADWGGGYISWDNWACSKMTDTQTPGSDNQYSAITGEGYNGSAQYAVSFPSFTTCVSTFSLPYATAVDGAYFTNTTYAYLSMLNGDDFAKKFGGASGNDPDWFMLTITGKNTSGDTVGAVEFYLADYRDANPANDYIINQWTSVPLTGLGNNVKTLEFGLTSSDTGPFGINTPTYFAMDDLSTPVENSWAGPQNSVWNNAANWSFGYMPGSGQNAIFNNNVNTTIDLNGDRNVQNVSFDTSTVGSFTINNDTLSLDAGGSITVTGAVITDQMFNCQLALLGNGSLINDSVASGQSLNINGDVISAASEGEQNLTLGGAGNGLISGTVGDGTSGGTLGLVKQGAGVWTLTNSTAYSGDTTIEDGLLQLNGAASNLHDISGQGDLGVGDGVNSATLTADSIAIDTLTIAAGAKIVLRPRGNLGPMGGGTNLTSVPEPANAALIAIAALGLLIWKARHASR